MSVLVCGRNGSEDGRRQHHFRILGKRIDTKVY
jgi:hypothetical protein